MRTPLFRWLALAAPMVLLFGTALTRVSAVHADEWCWGDPLVLVNNTTVAINVGVAGSAGDIRSEIVKVDITIVVADLDRARVLHVQQGDLHETVHFVEARRQADAGDVHISFTLSKHADSRRAAVQLTTNGVTSTVNGHTYEGIDAHFNAR